ncbi:hypothetical protein KR044_011218 [Drosophila immigrans]|nr:hypothetical protein KR044_011218 [Drosophila immigrans]
MRAGKKTATATVETRGKTRPCIVYLKNLKESETSELINSSLYNKQQRNVKRSPQPNTDKKERGGGDFRETRTTRRAASTVNVELLPKRANVAAISGKPPAATAVVAAARGRPPIKQQQLQLQQLKRRNTELPMVRAPIAINKRRDNNNTTITTTTTATTTTPKVNATKMYKQSKLSLSASSTAAVHTSPPPTIAASRSRRSIKPNPKYASDDMVTPKYVSGLGSETLHKRGNKQLFMDDDDDDEDDEDLHDLIEEDNDDELADVAFNPQLHKSDDDDDEEISEAEFEQQLRREKVPPKRGRGRPPKHPHAIAAAAAAQAARNAAASQSQQRAVQSASTASRGGTHLQQLRRSMAVSHMVRSNAIAGNKRKLEDQQDAPIARKRMATELNSGGRAPPVINGSTSVAKTTAIGLLGNQAKTKLIMSSGNNASGMRLIQATNAKQQQQQQAQQRNVSYFKRSTTSSSTVGRPLGVGVARTGPAARPVAGGNLKVHKASAAATSTGSPNAKLKADSDEVPTFTIVNIDDIINQDDVLITRSSNNSRKTPHTPRNISNNNSRSTSANNNHNNATPLNNSNTTGNSLSSSGKRIKIIPSVTTATAAAGKATNLKQLTLAEAKPRPRILNAEMGKKAPLMKPLMCMGKELCPMPNDSGDTEDEELADEDINSISPTIGAAQPRVVRRVQTAKWLPNARRQILATTPNASNNQRQQQLVVPASDRKLTKLLGESSDDDVVFKKPASPSTSATNTPQQQQHQQLSATATALALPAGGGKQAKFFPPETTTYCQEDGRVVKKITCYETWHVISTPKESITKTRQQRTCLELSLAKLANVASRIKVPSSKWTSKVTLYKVSPSLMQRQTMTIFTGDLKIYNIPEDDRHKYQPSCVLFRRSVLDRSKCRVPFDRAIIFKNKCFYANIEGKHVNLLGAPEVVNTVKDVEILIDIVDSLALSSDLVEMVTSK